MAKFQILKSSSNVNWTGKKVLGLHTGSIELVGGYIDISDEGVINNGEIIIDMTTIEITDIEDPKTKGDYLAHLQNDDFFSVDKFKTAKLVISETTKKQDNTFHLKGNLTIKDITNPVSFNTKVELFPEFKFMNLTGETVIDRTKYNMRYCSDKYLQNSSYSFLYDEFVLQFKLIAHNLKIIKQK